jgi:hypothetical protein
MPTDDLLADLRRIDIRDGDSLADLCNLLPAIIAALEAAERLRAAVKRQDKHSEGRKRLPDGRFEED